MTSSNSGVAEANSHLEIPLRHQLLQAVVLLLKLAQPLHVGGIELAELTPPDVDRLLTDTVFLGDLRDR